MVTIPTIAQLYTQVKSDLETAYGSSIPAFGKNFLRVQSAVQAAKLWVLYKTLGYVQKNVAPDTADSENVGGTLERFGRIKMNRNPFQATAAKYNVTVTATVGSTLSSKTTFKSNDDSTSPGKLFIVDTDIVITTNPQLVLLRAIEAGLESKLAIGDGLTATIPLNGINKLVIVAAEIISPLAAETIEEYRANVVASYQTETQGGAGTDYRIWGQDAQGVAQIYPYTAGGGGNVVNVYVEALLIDSSDGRGTPPGSMITDVTNVINFDPDDTKDLNARGRRPLNVIVNVLPVTPLPVNININSYIGLTADIQTQLTNAMIELLSTIRPFVDGTDILSDRNDVLDVNRIISKIFEATPGANFGAITLQVNGSTVTTYSFSNGDIPYKNNVTFV